MKRYLILITLVASAVIATQTKAADVYNQGSTKDAPEALTPSESRGFVGGIDGGFDVARNGWVFGLLGGYSFSNMESSLSVFDGAAELNLSKQDEWYLGGRLGRVVAPRTMFYLLAAYTQTEYELSGTGIDQSPHQSYSGIKAGTGVEYALGANSFFGLEYAHDFYGKQDWLNGDGIKISDSLDEDKIQATFKIKFGGDLPYIGD